MKSAHQRVGRQPRDDVRRVATGVVKITGHAGRDPAKVDTAMLDSLAAEPLARKALLLQSAIAGLIASHKVTPQPACALDELAGEVAAGLLDVVQWTAR